LYLVTGVQTCALPIYKAKVAELIRKEAAATEQAL
jgi:hypothetical protein